MFNRLLVAFDNSPHARRALSEAIDLARALDADLTVISVAPELTDMVLGYAAPASAFDALRADIDEGHRATLAAATATVPADVEVRGVLGRGDPATAILDEVRAGGHDLVMMGSRGLGNLRAMLLGSVSHHVLQASPVPVMVVHVDEESDRDAAGA